jgi:hypothetical protein
MTGDEGGASRPGAAGSRDIGGDGPRLPCGPLDYVHEVGRAHVRIVRAQPRDVMSEYDASMSTRRKH